MTATKQSSIARDPDEQAAADAKVLHLSGLTSIELEAHVDAILKRRSPAAH